MKRIDITKKMPKYLWYYNHFLKYRYGFIRNYMPFLLNNKGTNKYGEPIFEIDFCDLKDNCKYKVGNSGEGLFHPDNELEYYDENVFNLFASEYDPDTIKDLEGNEHYRPISSSHVTTAKTFVKHWGIWDFRTSLSNGERPFSCSWLSGPNWRREIDLSEQRPEDGKRGKVRINIHFGERTTDFEGNPIEYRYKLVGIDYRIEREKNLSNFNKHRFTCKWTSKYIKIYFDGILVWFYNDQNVLDEWFNNPIDGIWAIVNNGVKPPLAQNKIETYFGAMFVDWLKVYNNK